MKTTLDKIDEFDAGATGGPLGHADLGGGSFRLTADAPPDGEPVSIVFGTGGAGE